MKVSLIRTVKAPVRGTKLSAGIDFFVPEFNEKFVSDLIEKNNFIGETFEEISNRLSFTLNPNERILIPSGIKVNFEGLPKALIAFNKSGIAVKKGLDVLACVVDQDYQGEVHINLVNISNKSVTIFQDEKIAQFIIMPIFYEDIEVVEIENLYKSKTERGDGGFGSTNK